MERYYCNCLNIIINVNKNETRESNGKDLVPGAAESGAKSKRLDPFFNGKLLDVRLQISGIELSQPSLVKDRCHSDWLIFTCVNCGFDSHAVHATKGADRVLLAGNIKHGFNDFNAIKDSTAFSSFLQMKLIEDSERIKNEMCPLTRSCAGEAVEKIQESCRRLIQTEEDAKNERIRVFTESENHAFRDFRMKGNRDKENLTKLLKSGASLSADDSVTSLDLESGSFLCEKSEMNEHVSELPVFHKGSMSDRSGRGGSGQSGSIKMSNNAPIPPGKPVQNISSSLKSSLKKSVNHEKKLFPDSDDILFDMEGYQNEKECHPFFESDEDSDGESTSLESSGGFIGPSSVSRAIPASPGRSLPRGSSLGHDKNDKIYARSMPVAVPLFNNLRESYHPESDDETKSSPSLSKLAVSFKQVARSMQDSTGMVWELPPHRTERSGDMIGSDLSQSNPFGQSSHPFGRSFLDQ